MHNIVRSISCLACALVAARRDAAPSKSFIQAEARSAMNPLTTLAKLIGVINPVSAFQAPGSLAMKTPRRAAVPRLAPVDPPSNVMIVGPGSWNMKLVIAKKCQQAGYSTFIEASTTNCQEQWRKLMYGAEYATAEVDLVDKVQIVQGSDWIQWCGYPIMRTMSTVIAVAENNVQISQVLIKSFMKSSPRLKRVIFVSRIGITNAEQPKGALDFFFDPWDDEKQLLRSERYMRKECERYGVELSIVRVGVVKGGGSGIYANGDIFNNGGGVKRDGTDTSNLDWGLSSHHYYRTFDEEFQEPMKEFDRQNTGVKLYRGDPIEMPKWVQVYSERFDTGEPKKHETNLMNGGTAVVAALQYKEPIEVSVMAAPSSAEGEPPPPVEHFLEEFSRL